MINLTRVEFILGLLTQFYFHYKNLLASCLPSYLAYPSPPTLSYTLSRDWKDDHYAGFICQLNYSVVESR